MLLASRSMVAVDAEGVAEAAALLTSDRARNIGGVLLPIDGGYAAR